MNAMRALLLAVGFIVGCGDGGPGPAVGFAPPNRGGTTGAAGGGADRVTTGSDRGGGQASAIGLDPETEPTPVESVALQTCDERNSCGTGAYCNNVQGGVGHCFVTCSLETGQTVGDSPSCPSGWKCVRFSAGTVATCRVPCETAATCPSIPPLTTRCSIGYCGWTQATSTPS